MAVVHHREAYAPTASARDVRSFFGAQDHRNRRAVSRILHGTTIHGAERLRDDHGEPFPDRRRDHLLSCELAGRDRQRAQAAWRRSRSRRRAGTGIIVRRFREAGDTQILRIDASVIDGAPLLPLHRMRPERADQAGDARLTLAESTDRYDLIVLDAFSSDAIPIHLMTREAMATYVSRLAPHGIVLMHVSNRHMELSSVVAGIAHANGLTSRMNNRAARDDEDDAKYLFTSTVVISARDEDDFDTLREDADWNVIEPPAGQRIWTDDYSNVVGRSPPVSQSIRYLGGAAAGTEPAAAAGARSGATPAAEPTRPAIESVMPSNASTSPTRRRDASALLDRPPASRSFAPFAHCFTCGKDVSRPSARRRADRARHRGAAVRFHRPGERGRVRHTFSNVADRSPPRTTCARCIGSRDPDRQFGGAAVIAAANPGGARG